MKFYWRISTLPGMGALLDRYDLIVFVTALSIIEGTLGGIFVKRKVREA